MILTFSVDRDSRVLLWNIQKFHARCHAQYNYKKKRHEHCSNEIFEEWLFKYLLLEQDVISKQVIYLNAASDVSLNYLIIWLSNKMISYFILHRSLQISYQFCCMNFTCSCFNFVSILNWLERKIVCKWFVRFQPRI